MEQCQGCGQTQVLSFLCAFDFTTDICRPSFGGATFSGHIRGRPRSAPAPRATTPRKDSPPQHPLPLSPLIPSPLRAAASRGRPNAAHALLRNLLGPGSLSPVGASVSHLSRSVRTRDVGRLPARHPGTVQPCPWERRHSAKGEPNPRRGGGGLCSEPGGSSPLLPRLGHVLFVILWGRGAEPSCPSVPLRQGSPSIL